MFAPLAFEKHPIIGTTSTTTIIPKKPGQLNCIESKIMTPTIQIGKVSIDKKLQTLF